MPKNRTLKYWRSKKAKRSLLFVINNSPRRLSSDELKGLIESIDAQLDIMLNSNGGYI